MSRDFFDALNQAASTGSAKDVLEENGGLEYLAQVLGCHLEDGLVNVDLAERRRVFGRNCVPFRGQEPLIMMMWERCKDVVFVSLVVFSIIALVIDVVVSKTAWVKGLEKKERKRNFHLTVTDTCILVFLAVVITLQSLREFTTSRRLVHTGPEDLRKSHVVRNGGQMEIATSEIVVGDLVVLEAGAVVPGDGWLISGSVNLDESWLSGETMVVVKSRQEFPFLFAESVVVHGAATMLVTGIGLSTEHGRASRRLSDEDPSPVRDDLETEVVMRLGKFALISAAVVSMALFAVWCLNAWKFGLTLWTELLNPLLIGATILFIGVPSELPEMVTMAVSHLDKKKFVVRRLHALENMARVTTICVDMIALTDGSHLRPGIAISVDECTRAGISVRLMTGEKNLEVANRIAEESGIKSESGIALSGTELASMSELTQVVPSIQLLYNCRPVNKFLFVESLLLAGHIVCATGDGTGDGPTLQKASVGCVLGSGTAVAKDLGGIILLDDQFSSIVEAVAQGKQVFEAVQKLIQYQASVILVAMLLEFFGALYGVPTLSSAQLLYIYIIFDVVASYALILDGFSDSYMSRPPCGRWLTKTMLKLILGQVAFQLLVLLLILYLAPLIPFSILVVSRSRGHLTLVFNTFFWLSLFNLLNARSIHDEQNIFRSIHKSVALCLSFFILPIVQSAIVEFGGDSLGEQLSWDQWLFCIAIGLTCVPVGALIRAIKVTEEGPASAISLDQEEERLEGSVSAISLDQEEERLEGSVRAISLQEEERLMSTS